MFFVKSKDWKRELYDEHASILLGVAIRYCKNRENAEDVLHDTFITIFQDIGKYKGTGSLQGWMRRILVVNCIKHLKKNSSWNILEEENTVDESSVEQVEPIYSKEQLMSALNALSDGYRAVFNLYAIEGISHKEIGGILGISEGTSRSQFLRAKKSLREQLKQFEI